MLELWRMNGDLKSLQEWFQWFKEKKYSLEEYPSFSDFKETNLRSSFEDDVDLALGLGMKIILGSVMKKVPMAGIKWGGREYVFPSRSEILEHLRKRHGNIAGEMGRSNMIALDIDRKEAKEDDWLFRFIGRTLTNETPHGYHLFFWNDVFKIRLGHDRKGKPYPPARSSWLKDFDREHPTLREAFSADYDISRIRNEIAWLPPSETDSGSYHWMSPLRLPMLFSELLMKLS